MKTMALTGIATLLLSACNWGTKEPPKVICGGPGVGIDTATVKMLDSLYADPIEKDEPAPTTNSTTRITFSNESRPSTNSWMISNAVQKAT